MATIQIRNVPEGTHRVYQTRAGPLQRSVVGRPRRGLHSSAGFWTVQGLGAGAEPPQTTSFPCRRWSSPPWPAELELPGQETPINEDGVGWLEHRLEVHADELMEPNGPLAFMNDDRVVEPLSFRAVPVGTLVGQSRDDDAGVNDDQCDWRSDPTTMVAVSSPALPPARSRALTKIR